jgi:RHH-type rel operon transcriptional repressor/antitoxin RelB
MKGSTMPSTHTVRLPDDLTARLATLARITKRTKSYFIREALERTIEDLEDAYLAETAYEKFIKSGQKAIPLEEVERKLGLAD